ncbi:porin [Thioalkalivibrio sp. ALE28]|uniref:porin n=1 Tax=Thioalkalivibrio sp. ALE28 TaxID=1158179 RepID=UPI00038211E9|nr:porin [Thioalkalivibrio sp. ALE28]
MKKQILAVAVAGAFAVPAFAAADTNVTLFGQLQTQIVHHSGSGDGGTFNSGFRQTDAGGLGFGLGDGSGPSRIGVMVNHDLGNGLTALLKMESSATTQDAFGAARDNYVGLDGDFGRVIAGRMSSSYSTAGKDPLNATFMQGRANGARLGGLNGFGNGSYVNRGVRYSNSFGIVSLDAGVFIDNADDSDTAYSARLNFDLNPVELYIAHSQADDFVGEGRGPSPVFGDFRASKVGVDWSTGPFRLVAEVEDFDWDDASPTGSNRGNTYFVSGTYTMGRNDFVLNLGHTRLKDGDPNTDYAAIAVKHNFSNRVMAFAGVGYTSTDDAAIGPDTGDLSFTGVGGGMRVSF